MDSKIFYFSPLRWGNDPIWRAYFSDGLKPPARSFLRCELLVFGGGYPFDIWIYTLEVQHFRLYKMVGLEDGSFPFLLGPGNSGNFSEANCVFNFGIGYPKKTREGSCKNQQQLLFLVKMSNKKGSNQRTSRRFDFSTLVFLKRFETKSPIDRNA